MSRYRWVELLQNARFKANGLFPPPRLTLDQQRMEELDRAIHSLRAGDEVQLSWFVPVKKIGDLELGEFRTATGRVIRIDLEKRVIDLAGETVGMEDVFVVVGGTGGK